MEHYTIVAVKNKIIVGFGDIDRTGYLDRMYVHKDFQRQFDWSKNFDKKYLDNIRYYCFVMSENYIRSHFADIKKYASII